MYFGLLETEVPKGMLSAVIQILWIHLITFAKFAMERLLF